MLWGRATEGERLQVVEAFGANTRVLQVEMANAHANDALAAAWARSLSTNNSLTSLNLESNSIGAGGIEALAEALLENRALTELKLANQRVACSQRAEESLAAALAHHPALVRLTIDARSTQARDAIARHLQRNQERARELKKRQSSPDELPAARRTSKVGWRIAPNALARGHPHRPK